MRMRCSRQVAIVAGVLLVASVAHAGQLFTQLYGIEEVVSNPGVAILGTLLAIDAAKGTVRLAVKRVWVAPGHAAEVVTVGSRVHVAPGATIEVPLEKGVVWDDPNKSPIDRRVRGHLELAKLKTAQQVVLLSNELVAATPDELRKLDLFFAAEGVAGYLTHAEASRLRADLEDFDLSAPAAAELERRHALDVGTLLSIRDDLRRSERLHARWRAVDDPGKVELVGELRRRLEAAPSPALAAQVLQMIEYELTPPMLTDVAALALMVPEAKAEGLRYLVKRIEDLRNQPGAPVASAPVVQLLLGPHLSEPSTEGLVTFAATLRDEERAILEDTLIERLGAALGKRDADGSLRAMSQLHAIELAQPSVRVAPKLAQLDVTRLPFQPRTSATIDLVEVVMALATLDRATIPVLKPSMEKLLASDSGTENMTTQQGDDGTSFSIGIVQTVESMMNSDAFDAYKLRFRKGTP